MAPFSILGRSNAHLANITCALVISSLLYCKELFDCYSTVI